MATVRKKLYANRPLKIKIGDKKLNWDIIEKKQPDNKVDFYLDKTLIMKVDYGNIPKSFQTVQDIEDIAEADLSQIKYKIVYTGQIHKK